MHSFVSEFYGFGHLLVAVSYLLLAVAYARSGARDVGGAVDMKVSSAGSLGAWILATAVIVHGGLLGYALFAAETPTFGFAQALSATLWLAVMLAWLEGFFVPMRGLLLLLLPAAALASVLPVFFVGAPLPDELRSMTLRVHLVVAIFAYSLFTIAALHAVLMALLERQLHAARTNERFLGPLYARLPSLLTLETLLFRLLWAGFVLLTATLISGVVFSEQLFGRPIKFDHKTDLAIVSWCVFAALLAGRAIFGWRGRIALRWTFIGFFMLLLAYVGSRFVHEVVLGR